MRQESILTEDLHGLRRAAFAVNGRFRAAGLCYYRARFFHASREKVRAHLEDYLVYGQQYRTALEMLAAGLRAAGASREEGGEEARVGILIERLDREMRKLTAHQTEG